MLAVALIGIAPAASAIGATSASGASGTAGAPGAAPAGGVALAGGAALAGAASGLAQATGSDEGSGQVWSVLPQPDGSVEYSVYRAAEGFSAAELFAELRAEGVPGLRSPAQRDQTGPDQDPFTCYHGTAYAFDSGRCPPARWTNGGHSDPQVYFRDHTPSAWPVRAAVAAWNRAVGIDSYWTTGGCPAGGRHCVDVWSGNYGANGWTGNTTYRLNASRNLLDGSVRVRLNDYYAASAADRRNSTCHELGHALGVAHNLSTGSCVYYRDIAANPQLPHSSDYNLLRYVVYPG